MGYSVETKKSLKRLKYGVLKKEPQQEASVSLYMNELILKDIESNCELSFARIEDAIKNIRGIK